MATLAINGALRTTPTDLLDAHAGTFPIELTLLKVCHRATTRMCTLLQTHPIHQLIRSAASKRPKKHLGPLDHLFERYNINPSKLETIYPTNEDTQSESILTEIANTREGSIEQEKGDNADFKIYSDRSGNNGETGAAAVLYNKGQTEPVKSTQKYIGPAQEHNTYKAEVVGAILAMWLIKSTPETSGKTVSLYTDNQSLIHSMHRPRATSGQHLVKNLISEAKKVNARLQIKWISGHSNVPGNEKADELAGEAAGGRSSRQEDLPPKLRFQIPMSASATKQEYHSSLLRKWKAMWTQFPRRTKFSEQIDEDFLFTKYRKLRNGLTREQASIVMQIRCRHIPLNAYLHRIEKSASRMCQKCNQGEEGVPETVKHFVFECPTYTENRRVMENVTGRGQTDLKEIMTDLKKLKALTAYINQTKRFKQQELP
jgi:ribonuclease HI